MLGDQVEGLKPGLLLAVRPKPLQQAWVGTDGAGRTVLEIHRATVNEPLDLAAFFGDPAVGMVLVSLVRLAHLLHP